MVRTKAKNETAAAVGSEEHGVLTDIRALGQEIEHAIAAIRCNSLSVLQKSIASQEVLCAQLNAAANHATPEPDGQQVTVTAEFEHEVKSLRALIHTYGALLQQCGKTNALLISLCRSYTGTYHAAHAVLARSRTLSCEV